MGTFIKSTFTTTDRTAPRVVPLYARDTFNRADSASLGSTEVGGYAWKDQQGTYRILGKQLTSGDTTGASPADLWVDLGKKDAILTMEPVAMGAGLMAALLFRRAGVGHTGWVYYARPQTHTLAIRTGTDNFTVVDPTGSSPGFTAGERMKVELIGDRIICSVDGLVTHDITNTTYQAQTGVGLTTRAATAAAPAKFDNWSYSSR